MSGIVAIFGSDAASQENLDNMCKPLLHNSSVIVERCFYNGMCLAFMHWKEGEMSAYDDDLHVFMDGEIFGYEEEKSKLEKRGCVFKAGGGAEFCLHAYRQYGEEFVKKLNGRFIVAVVEKKKGAARIFNDRMGTKPFYYYTKDGKTLFASEVKAILQNSMVKREVNDDAVADFFAFDKVIGGKTPIKDIYIFPSASICTMEGGKPVFRRYWEMNFDESYGKPSDYYVEGLCSSLGTAVKRVAPEGVHFTLSGGLDTRLVISVLGRREKLHTLTIGDSSYDEVKIANEIARKIGSRHEVITLDGNMIPESIMKGVYVTDGMCNCRHFGFFYAIDDIGKNRDVIISSAGLGELLGDFFVKDDVFNLSGGDDTLKYCYKNFNTIINESEASLLFSDDYFDKIKGRAYESIKKEFEESKRHATIPANILYHLMFTNSLRQVFFYCEFTTLGLNIRLPCVDNDFIDFVLSIPPELRVNRNIEYEAIRKKSPELSGIYYNQTGFPVSYPLKFHKIGQRSWKDQGSRRILDEISRRDGRVVFPDRIEYIDLVSRLRDNKKVVAFFNEILLSKRTMERNYFRPEYIKRMLAEHILGKKDNSVKLCSLVTFELWHRFFIDGDPAPDLN